MDAIAKSYIEDGAVSRWLASRHPSTVKPGGQYGRLLGMQDPGLAESAANLHGVVA